jgi:hypothetical protein
MRLFSNPRMARLIAKALWRDGRTIHECPSDSRHFPMLGRFYLMQRREVVRKHVDVEQLARELGVLEIPPPPRPSPPPPPPGAMVDIKALIGTRRVTPQQAAANRERGLYPMQPRPAQPGLVNLDAKALWRSIEVGSFPAPVRGPNGLEWPLDAVLRWKQSNHQ